MNFDYSEKIGALSATQRLYFYSLFAHQLTVALRGVMFFEGVADAERVERAKWLNEIAHRITFNVFALQKNAAEFSEADILEMIQQNIEKYPDIETEVNQAIESSYGYVITNESVAQAASQ